MVRSGVQEERAPSFAALQGRGEPKEKGRHEENPVNPVSQDGEHEDPTSRVDPQSPAEPRGIEMTQPEAR